MPVPRRAHNKSRHGCLQCRTRRVKCDEVKPSCTRCTKRRETCSYAAESESAHDWPAESEVPISRSTSRGKELYLMHHYSTKTCETMSLKPGHHELWKYTIPRAAMRHEYLADVILALAALHLATLEPAQSAEHIKTAMQYQDSGIRAFKEALSNVSDDNIAAMFSFSVMITILNVASTGICLDWNPSENLISIFELLRGVEAVMNSSEDVLKTGPLKTLFELPNLASQVEPDPVDQALRAEAMASLRERARAISKYVGPQTYETYLAGIHSLEETYEEFVKFPGRHGTIMAWPVMAPRHLIVLLKQGDPMGLLIWIHYGALALEIHKHWWGRDFGVLLIQDLSESLLKIDREWEPYIEWARSRADKIRGQTPSSAQDTPSEQ